ncbi:hypothetical protein B0H14DRAFT_2644507 [Mycena olivaceomarginata]|nr:hypothetical protein B0H14DRAFT_2644507 [Mycena olivaceomarginata]
MANDQVGGLPLPAILISTQFNDDWNNKLPLNGTILGEGKVKPDLRYTPFNRPIAHRGVGILQRIARNANNLHMCEGTSSRQCSPTPQYGVLRAAVLIAGLDVGPSFDSRSGRDTTVENQVQRRNQRQVQHASALRWPGGNGHDHDQVKWLVSANGAFHRTTASPTSAPPVPEPSGTWRTTLSQTNPRDAPVRFGRKKKKDHILVLLTSPPTEEVTRPSGFVQPLDSILGLFIHLPSAATTGTAKSINSWTSNWMEFMQPSQ